MEMMIVLAIIAIVMGLLIGPRLLDGSRRAKRSQTRIEEAQLVSAYTEWSWDHAGCPETLFDLNRYVRRKHMNDPWGTEYEMLCGEVAPPPADGFGVLSYAEDRRRDTPDDIASWDAP